MVKDEQLFTPPIETGALGGITRKTVMEIAKYLDIDLEEKNLTREDLISADEIFFTGTATEIVGVVQLIKLLLVMEWLEKLHQIYGINI